MSNYFTGSFNSNTPALVVDVADVDRLVYVASTGGGFSFGFSSTTVAVPFETPYGGGTSVSTSFVLPAATQLWGTGQCGFMVTKSTTLSICS